jgi:hypothetical protein
LPIFNIATSLHFVHKSVLKWSHDVSGARGNSSGWSMWPKGTFYLRTGAVLAPETLWLHFRTDLWTKCRDVAILQVTHDR